MTSPTINTRAEKTRDLSFARTNDPATYDPNVTRRAVLDLTAGAYYHFAPSRLTRPDETVEIYTSELPHREGLVFDEFASGQAAVYELVPGLAVPTESTDVDRPAFYRGRRRAGRVPGWAWAVLGAIVTLILVGCGVPQAESGYSVPDSGAPVATKAAPKPSAGKAAAKAFTVGSGVHEVPGDVKPGKYRTTAPADGTGCYWARLKATDGELTSIIANGNLDAGARGVLVVKKSDRGLQLDGECVWTVSK